jgi:hypothetical protein
MRDHLMGAQRARLRLQRKREGAPLGAAEIVMKHSGWGLKPGDEAQLMRMLTRLPE